MRTSGSIVSVRKYLNPSNIKTHPPYVPYVKWEPFRRPRICSCDESSDCPYRQVDKLLAILAIVYTRAF